MVAPREGRVSRNNSLIGGIKKWSIVAPREGRVSRNQQEFTTANDEYVAPREGRVSRNTRKTTGRRQPRARRAPRGACE